MGPNLISVTTREESMADVRDAEKLLLIEEADAWFEYLEATRAQTAARYSEIEPWAWSRLRQRLRAIRARRARLRRAVGLAPPLSGSATPLATLDAGFVKVHVDSSAPHVPLRGTCFWRAPEKEISLVEACTPIPRHRGGAGAGERRSRADDRPGAARRRD